LVPSSPAAMRVAVSKASRSAIPSPLGWESCNPA